MTLQLRFLRSAKASESNVEITKFAPKVVPLIAENPVEDLFSGISTSTIYNPRLHLWADSKENFGKCILWPPRFIGGETENDLNHATSRMTIKAIHSQMIMMGFPDVRFGKTQRVWNVSATLTLWLKDVSLWLHLLLWGEHRFAVGWSSMHPQLSCLECAASAEIWFQIWCHTINPTEYHLLSGTDSECQVAISSRR